MGLVDIHTHIIPDVDDGARSFEDALKTISILKSFGIDTIIATPHKRGSLFEFDAKKVRENFIRLSNMLIERGIEVRLHLGAEYYFGPDLFEDINEKGVYVIGNSKYILVEFGSLRLSNLDRENIFRVLSSGYKLIVAHIERLRFNSETLYMLEYLRDNSALFQCDIMSLNGLWGEEARLFMTELIKKNYVDIFSTDVHCKDYEEELLKKSFDTLRTYQNDLPDRLMGDNIKKILGLL